MSEEEVNFDLEGFYGAVDSARKQRQLNWKQVADETKVSASTLSRMGSGKRPDADSLAALAAWSGINPANFVRASYAKLRGDFLTSVAEKIHSDPHLSPANKTALDDMIRAAYSSLAKPPEK